MADRPGEHKAQETREVVAEAAASLKEDPVYQNAAECGGRVLRKGAAC
jgi:hypothetical protein